MYSKFEEVNTPIFKLAMCALEMLLVYPYLPLKEYSNVSFQKQANEYTLLHYRTLQVVLHRETLPKVTSNSSDKRLQSPLKLT